MMQLTELRGIERIENLRAKIVREGKHNTKKPFSRMHSAEETTIAFEDQFENSGFSVYEKLYRHLATRSIIN